MGVVVPLVADAAQAQTIVECAKYPLAGRRGTAFAIAHDDYRGGDLAAKIRQINDEVMIIAQIETVRGLEEVDRIAAVDGIDALWIGQFDLTTSMGIPGQFDRPEFRAATRRVVEACQRHGKAAVLAVMDVGELCAGPSNGFRMLVYAADLWIYQQALRRCFGSIRESLEGGARPNR
jgi:2-dehydro-3-deoxyglucarate aldolase/4-hydroxy-2-oxoheptanedioate aldolase